jgi:hypothetical protein
MDIIPSIRTATTRRERIFFIVENPPKKFVFPMTDFGFDHTDIEIIH